MDRPDDGVAAARAELLSNLAALRQAVLATATLANVLDSGWFDAVEAEIKRTSPPRPSATDPSGFLYDFCHPLRGVDWFEKAQQLAIEGRRSEIGDEAKFALAFAGLDPIRTIVPSLDARLQAFSSLSFKPEAVRVKLAELRAARQNPSFKNHLFELSVMGDLALKKVLTDIEDPATAVDGVINIDGRDILVEATNTTQRVIPDFVGVFSVDPNVEINQVVKKVRKKVADGRQLARANGKPTVLFLARTHLGADRDSAKVALRECFRDTDFSTLSGVVVADSWKLFVTEWYPGERPDVPLTAREVGALKNWYARRA